MDEDGDLDQPTGGMCTTTPDVEGNAKKMTGSFVCAACAQVQTTHPRATS